MQSTAPTPAEPHGAPLSFFGMELGKAAAALSLGLVVTAGGMLIGYQTTLAAHAQRITTLEQAATHYVPREEHDTARALLQQMRADKDARMDRLEHKVDELGTGQSDMLKLLLEQKH
jgi:multidrug resistance efflux pump